MGGIIMQKLTNDLHDNVKMIIETFNDDLLKSRFFTNDKNRSIEFCVLYFNNLVNKQYIHLSIIKSILEYVENIENNSALEDVKENILFNNDVKESSDFEEITENLMRGKTILLVDRSESVLIIDTDFRISRSLTEPDGEKVLRGPREGFVESLITNISLIRHIIINPDLKFEYQDIGEKTTTKACICYIKNTVDENVLKELKKRLKTFKPDGILDTNAISEAIKDGKYSPFKTIGATERPDAIAAKLLEGKVGLMVDGSPVALTIPYLFTETFQTGEDYYVNLYFSSIGRLIRLLGFFLSVSLPGLYVAIVTHHWEIIPTPLLMAISQSQQGIPFPTIFECFSLLIVFELLRETGLRAPTGIGQSISVVGAIVVGQAAVDARLVSSTMIFIIALTAITGLINTKIKGASIFFRFTILFAGALLGLYGCLFIYLLILIHILNLKSFGVQYTERFFPFKLKNIQDGLLRLPSKSINKS
jgi:spore germination protein KA